MLYGAAVGLGVVFLLATACFMAYSLIFPFAHAVPKCLPSFCLGDSTACVHLAGFRGPAGATAAAALAAGNGSAAHLLATVGNASNASNAAANTTASVDHAGYSYDPPLIECVLSAGYASCVGVLLLLAPSVLRFYVITKSRFQTYDQAQNSLKKQSQTMRQQHQLRLIRMRKTYAAELRRRAAVRELELIFGHSPGLVFNLLTFLPCHWVGNALCPAGYPAPSHWRYNYDTRSVARAALESRGGCERPKERCRRLR